MIVLAFFCGQLPDPLSADKKPESQLSPVISQHDAQSESDPKTSH